MLFRVVRRRKVVKVRVGDVLRPEGDCTYPRGAVDQERAVVEQINRVDLVGLQREPPPTHPLANSLQSDPHLPSIRLVVRWLAEIHGSQQQSVV